jgi:hypothetical protein
MKYYYQIEGNVRNNIGDVLQGMVAKAFLPNDAIAVDREALSNIDTNEPGLFIANGWYMHSFDKFPPPININPVYISVHVSNSALLASKKIRDHFVKNSPIGCRDIKTLRLFLGWGIPAYYSSCLTITTKPREIENNKKNDDILLVDNVDHPIPDEVKIKLEKMFNKSFIRISHDPPVVDVEFKEYARSSEMHMNKLLEKYCAASLVVTTKIHCALPCLGMGANVLFIHPNPEDPRLSTVKEFIDIISYKQVLANDHIAIPAVKTDKLKERRNFLSEVVSSSVQNGFSVVVKPTNIQLKKLHAKSSLHANLVRAGIVLAYKLGINKKQIERVYGSGF